VEGMICKWGLRTLQAGCVMDVGGDPGFVSAELLHAGINVTVLDPAFGCSGKADPATTHHLSHSPANLTLIRKPFNQDFVDDPENASLMRNVSAFVSLYPDEATDFLIAFTAAHAMRIALIPCNECAQYFPPQEPTYEGFVRQLLMKDRYYASCYGQKAHLQRERICGAPFCQTLLQRTPEGGACFLPSTIT